MLADYHVHTRRCGHAEGETRAYVEEAIAAGLVELGFADHLPLVRDWRPGFSMLPDEMCAYVAEIKELADEYAADIVILAGIEADYYEEAEDEVRELLAAQPFDYVIGSVHTLSDGLGFDQRRQRRRFAAAGVDRVFLENYRLLARVAGSGLCDVVGHLDLPKKYGHQPADAAAVGEAARGTLQAVRAAGIAIELNTAGWRAPAGQAYPAAGLLAEAAAAGIPLIFGSDAHRPGEVGDGFPRAAALARGAGYTHTLRMSDRSLVELP